MDKKYKYYLMSKKIKNQRFYENLVIRMLRHAKGFI